MSNYRQITPFAPTRGAYRKYYETSQLGQGLPAYRGSKHQRGHGIGSLIGGLFRAAVPLVMPVLKNVGKAAATTALSAGAGLIGDVLKGKNLKKSAVNRAREGGKALLKRAANSDYLRGVTQAPPTKRRATSKGKTSVRRSRMKSTLF